jgi:hypothetical protein
MFVLVRATPFLQGVSEIQVQAKLTSCEISDEQSGTEATVPLTSFSFPLLSIIPPLFANSYSEYNLDAQIKGDWMA